MKRTFLEQLWYNFKTGIIYGSIFCISYIGVTFFESLDKLKENFYNYLLIIPIIVSVFIINTPIEYLYVKIIFKKDTVYITILTLITLMAIIGLSSRYGVFNFLK